MRGRILVLLGCVGALLATAWYAGSRFDPPAPPPAAGTVELGPEPGEAVGDYLARLPAELPAPGVPVLALVQLNAELTPQQAAALLALVAPGTPVASGTQAAPGAPAATRDADGAGPPATPPAAVATVFRVPLPRVQTALRFADLVPGPPPLAALAAAREQARFAAAGDADRRTGRAAAVAAAEASALADPACGCVLALVVRADRSGLAGLATHPAVRAVHAAPAGVAPAELALSPLLPGQTERADPLPDDGNP